MNWIDLTLWLHLATTLYMVGLIWFIQVVHYPLMHRMGAAAEKVGDRGLFIDFEAAHQARTTLVVGPPMLIEGVTAALLFAVFAMGSEAHATAVWSAAGLGLVVFNTVSTALIQVPLHRRLESGYDAAVVRRLVTTNWVRTAAWSARGAVAIMLCILGPPAA